MAIHFKIDMTKKKVVIVSGKKKKRPGKRTRKANKGIIEWVTGNQDLTRTPIGRRVMNVARHGPMGVFKGKKGKMMGDMRNARLTGKSGKLADIGGSSSLGRAYITTISERMERIGTITSGTDFINVQQCALNPGLAPCFPWLSTVAANYELYKFNRLWFEYRTTSGEVMSGTNPALGKVCMVTNYDVIQPPFITIEEMENYEGNTNFPPYQLLARHEVDVRGRSMGQVLPYTRRYVRNGPVPSVTAEGGAGDPHAYDIGLFQVGVQGMPANSNQVGELWVGYSIDLIKPRPSINPNSGQSWAVSGPAAWHTVGGSETVLPTTDFVMDNPSLDVLYEPIGHKFTINNTLGRSFVVAINFQIADAPDPNGFITDCEIDLLDGAFFHPGAAGFTPQLDFYPGYGATSYPKQSLRYSIITAGPLEQKISFHVRSGDLEHDPAPSIYGGQFHMNISTWSNNPPPDYLRRVFQPSKLVCHDELELLRKEFAKLRCDVESKDEERSERFSVVSSVSASRPPSRVSSLKK